ncbi:hypothetical protein Tco_0097959 [Tanacetum coccineum]
MEKKDTLSSHSDSEKQQMQLIQDKSKESCMVSFQQLHSHLKCLSNNDLKGSRTEDGFKRAFATLFGQDLETFTGTMFLYMDQLQKQLNNEEFQEIGFMYAFKVLETQQTIRKGWYDKKLQIQECTVQEVKALDCYLEEKQKEWAGIFSKTSFTPQASFTRQLKRNSIESGFKREFATLFGRCETFIGTNVPKHGSIRKNLTQEEFKRLDHASFKVLETQFQNTWKSVKKSIDERAQHKYGEYDSWVNERQIQTTEDKVDTGKAVDANFRSIYMIEEPMVDGTNNW